MGGFIELFAGCGGLSLGLQAAGHARRMANELSPMAAESYAFNLLGTDLRDDPSGDALCPVQWLRSQFPDPSDGRRLFEDPGLFGEAPLLDGLDEVDFEGKLIVGDIRHLNEFVDQRKDALVHGVDIVSGGPPCQSFSMAGLRQFGNQRNRLPWEFAQFVASHQPRVALLENVSGILRPFVTEEGVVHAWFEVAKAFAAIKYAPICLQVNARDVGVAQNRPRYLMIAIREDLVEEVAGRLGPAREVLFLGEELLRSSEQDVNFNPARHRIVDLTKQDCVDRYSDSPLQHLFAEWGRPRSVGDAIGDLIGESGKSAYVRDINNRFNPTLVRARPRPDAPHVLNDEKRQHTARVQARFVLYQVLDRMVDAGYRGEADAVRRYLKGMEEISSVSEERVLHRLLEWGLRDADNRYVSNTGAALTALCDLRTKKRTQRALRRDRPAPAALSIPDDACHYSEPRTLSVREMARIQSFPDDFEFRSVPTTGGARRKYQVPQYTQVGNAVPPLLGFAVGRLLNDILGVGQIHESKNQLVVSPLAGLAGTVTG